MDAYKNARIRKSIRNGAIEMSLLPYFLKILPNLRIFSRKETDPDLVRIVPVDLVKSVFDDKQNTLAMMCVGKTTKNSVKG